MPAPELGIVEMRYDRARNVHKLWNIPKLFGFLDGGMGSLHLGIRECRLQLLILIL